MPQDHRLSLFSRFLLLSRLRISNLRFQKWYPTTLLDDESKQTVMAILFQSTVDLLSRASHSAFVHHSVCFSQIQVEFKCNFEFRINFYQNWRRERLALTLQISVWNSKRRRSEWSIPSSHRSRCVHVPHRIFFSQMKICGRSFEFSQSVFQGEVVLESLMWQFHNENSQDKKSSILGFRHIRNNYRDTPKSGSLWVISIWKIYLSESWRSFSSNRIHWFSK